MICNSKFPTYRRYFYFGTKTSEVRILSLRPFFEDFVRQQVNRGHYGSVSETIRADLRLLEERETKLSLLRKALTEGLIQELDAEQLK
jgi:antitoxin ParD1/3/4